MSDSTVDAVAAGLRLRSTRESAGLSVDAMAGMLKVPPARLQALEDARLDELPDLAFARALAQAQCRMLRIDPGEVLGLLPRPESVGRRLEQVNAGLGGHRGAGALRQRRPPPSGNRRRTGYLLALLLIMVLAVVGGWMSGVGRVQPEGRPVLGPVPAPPSEAAASAPGSPGGAPVVSSVETPAAVSDAAATTAVVAGGAMTRTDPDPAPLATVDATGGRQGSRLKAEAPAWVRVSDPDGRILFEKTLATGESLELDPRRPLRLELGNASATVLIDGGRTVDLGPWTRDNVARLSLE